MTSITSLLLPLQGLRLPPSSPHDQLHLLAGHRGRLCAAASGEERCPGLAAGNAHERFCRTPVSGDTRNCLAARHIHMRPRGALNNCKTHHLAALSGFSCTTLSQGNRQRPLLEAPASQQLPSCHSPQPCLAPPLPCLPFSCAPSHQPPATELQPLPAPSPTPPASGSHTAAPTLHLPTLLTARGVLDSLRALACTTSSSRRV